MRFFAYLFQGVLALFLLALSGMALSTDAHSLKLGMLPWKGESLTYWLFFGALTGLVIVILAVRGILPALFFVWSLLVAGLLVKGYIFSSYYFSPGEFKTALMLIAGALISVLGAWFAMKQRPARS